MVTAVVQVRLGASLGKVMAAAMKRNYFSVAEQTRPGNRLEMWDEESKDDLSFRPEQLAI